MSITDLKRKLAKKELNNLYIFYGPEEYLKNKYIDEIRKIVVKKDTADLNEILIEGKVEAGKVIEACRTMPFFSDKKLVIIKNSGLLKSGSVEFDKLAPFLEEIPEYAVVIFVEAEISAKIKNTKFIKEHVSVVEFNYQKPKDLARWVVKTFKNYNKNISIQNASRIIEYCEPDMTGIFNEIEKIVMYMGDNTTVDVRHIEDVVTKSVKARVFDLMDAIFEKEKNRAITLLYDMLNLKEPIPRILYMITRQLRMVLGLKILTEQGIPPSNAATRLGVQPFVVRKLAKQIRNYDIQTLKEAMEECQKLDFQIKTGQIDAQTGVELFIIKYAAV